MYLDKQCSFCLKIYITGAFRYNNYVRITYKERECVMPQISPITDLRNTNDIPDACHATKETLASLRRKQFYEGRILK